jgi:anti-anti-sigma factor
MQIRQTVDGSSTRLFLEGRFDFHSHRDFRAASEAVLQDNKTREIIVDFSKVDYLDSSALGMLLLLRERAETAGKLVVLAALQGTAKQVLEVANFGRLFTFRN